MFGIGRDGGGSRACSMMVVSSRMEGVMVAVRVRMGGKGDGGALRVGRAQEETYPRTPTRNKVCHTVGLLACGS